MAKFPKAYAKILAGMLSEEACQVMLLLSGRGEKRKEGISEKTIDELVELELARKDMNLLSKKPMAVLVITNRGKKVAAEIVS